MGVFDHLLVVAGPSGVGKSTLIDQLAGGQAPPEIASCLPSQVGAWPVLPVVLFRDWPPARGGAVVHVDTTECFLRPRVYDNVLPLIGTARAITALDIGGDPDDIATRLFERTWQLRDRRTADPSVSRDAFAVRFAMSKNDSAMDLAAIDGLAARAGIPAYAARKLALTRRADWAALVWARWDGQRARHWAGRTVDFVAVETVHRDRAEDGRIWRLSGTVRKTC